jgi:protein SCO1/2
MRDATLKTVLTPWADRCLAASHRSVLVIAVTIAAVLGSACNAGTPARPPAATPTTSDATPYTGTVIRIPLAKPDAVLTDTSGQPFDFRNQTDGYVTLVYVGYTHCPDACPTYMATIASAMARLPGNIRNRIKVLFITDDPARDTPQVMRTWLDLFDKTFIGLTGDDATLAKVLETLDVQPGAPTDLGNGDYSVRHAAYVIAYTQDNLAHLRYLSQATVSDWISNLATLVTDGWKGG